LLAVLVVQGLGWPGEAGACARGCARRRRRMQAGPCSTASTKATVGPSRPDARLPPAPAPQTRRAPGRAERRVCRRVGACDRERPGGALCRPAELLQLGPHLTRPPGGPPTAAAPVPACSFLLSARDFPQEVLRQPPRDCPLLAIHKDVMSPSYSLHCCGPPRRAACATAAASTSSCKQTLQYRTALAGSRQPNTGRARRHPGAPPTRACVGSDRKEPQR
jgi:hypothetical protein